MLLLRATGVDRADPAVESAVARLEAGYQWDEEFRDKPFKTFFEGEVEPCMYERARLEPTSRRHSRS
jgi:hypothetical protein